jgi:agmatinase
MVDWTKELNVVDYGDAPIDYLSTERTMEPVRQMVREVAQTGAIPFIVGGDHSLEYPNVAGVADVYGKENVGVIHFDAHYDAGTPHGGHLISHGQPIRRLINEGHVLGKNYIQVGLRGYWPGEDGFRWMREQGFRYHTMAEIEREGWDAVMSRVLAEATDGPQHLYISFDIDVLDPAYTPGTGTPEPGGLTPREVFPLVRNLCAQKNLVGFDLVEVNPLVDPGYTTALNANRLLRECLTGVAMRKKGLTEEQYLSPLTREHGRRPQD